MPCNRNLSTFSESSRKTQHPGSSNEWGNKNRKYHRTKYNRFRENSIYHFTPVFTLADHRSCG